MKLFLGNVKIVVDRHEHSSYLLINETGNNKQSGDKMNIYEIYEKIAVEFAATGSMREAYDRVMGDGAFEKLAGEVYDGIKTI